VNKYFSEVACPHYASLHCGGDSSKIYSLKEGVDDFLISEWVLLLVIFDGT